MSLLAIRGLTKRFGGLTALQDFSLTVEPGEIRGLIGPNGSGKSTVINLVTGVIGASDGSMRLRDEEVTGRSPDALFRRGVARTFQTPRLAPDLTALENVLIGRARFTSLEILRTLAARGGRRRAEHGWRAAAQEMLEMVGLGARAETPADRLPHGQRRLLEIARALAGAPTLLLLDEPVAGLTESEASAVMTLLRSLADRGMAIVLVEHNMRVMMAVAHRVTVLDFGRTIAEGHPATVRADPAVLEAYLGRVDDDRDGLPHA